MIQRHGWNLLFHDCLIAQLQKLDAAAARVRAQDPERYESNANTKLFAALAILILETIPGDPNREEYRQGNTMGPGSALAPRQIGRRFRLFFRFDSDQDDHLCLGERREHLTLGRCQNRPLSSFRRCSSRATHLMTGTRC